MSAVDPTLAQMRGSADAVAGSVRIERVFFNPGRPYAIRVMEGRKKVGPLLFPRDGQTIGECLDEFLTIEVTA